MAEDKKLTMQAIADGKETKCSSARHPHFADVIRQGYEKLAGMAG